MFDAWNSNAELTDLSKKVFAKLQEIMDGQKEAYWATPYPIRFKSNEYLQKAHIDLFSLFCYIKPQVVST